MLVVDVKRDDGFEIQENEYLVDQDYDPFHVKCGKDVFFSDKRLIATRKSDWWTDSGVVYSAKPIPLGGMFQVKLLEEAREWIGFFVSARSNLPYIIHCAYSKVGESISS